jgi:signal transduction histidine kinase
VNGARGLLNPAFLERAAHDIRGPAGVISYVLEELGGQSGVAIELVDRARRGVARMLRVADRLSRAAQLESGALALSMERLELVAILRECVQEATRAEPRTEVTVHFAEPSGPCLVDADARWISAALVDVMIASIRRARANVRIELVERGSGKAVVVHDDGVRSSLPADVFADLPFALAGATVERHGWRLEVEDPPAAERGLLHGGRVVLAFQGAE